MLEAKNGEELLRICEAENIPLSEYAIRIEMEKAEITREEAYSRMRNVLEVMKDGANEGRAKEVHSVSGLIGGDGYKIQKYLENNETLTGDVIVKAMAMALSSSEVNASMGRIVACPTAGSCGILPAVVLSAGERLKKSDAENEDLKKKLVEYQNLENTLRRSLLIAEESNKELRRVAKNESIQMVEEARRNASRIVNDALIKAERIEANADALKRRAIMYKRKIKQLLDEQNQMLDKFDDIEY